MQRKQKPLNQNTRLLNEFIEALKTFKKTSSSNSAKGIFGGLAKKIFSDEVDQKYLDELIGLIKTYRDASDNFTKHSQNLLDKINEGISFAAKAPIFMQANTPLDLCLKTFLRKLKQPEKRDESDDELKEFSPRNQG